MASIFRSLITSLCGIFLSLILFVLAAIFRNLPAAFRFISNAVHIFLRFSYRAYKYLFTVVFNLLDSPQPSRVWRVILSTLLSLLIFNGLYFLFRFSISGWISGFSFVHGLSVGIVWEKLDDPYGLNLGVKIS